MFSALFVGDLSICRISGSKTAEPKEYPTGAQQYSESVDETYVMCFPLTNRQDSMDLVIAVIDYSDNSMAQLMADYARNSVEYRKGFLGQE